MALFIAYSIVVTLVLIWVLWNFRRNLRDLIPLSSFHWPASTRKPLVSLLVPARNEERNIERCLYSLLAQDYEVFEILVLNDHSTDGTRAIVERISVSDERVRLIEGKPLPSGWVGKGFACHQLFQEAQGEYLLFVDADTWLAPFAVSSSMAATRERKADFLSLMPHEKTQTLSERLSIPFINLAVMWFFPLRKIWGSPNPLFSFAVGQFMLFRRGAYLAVGGHAAVRAEILEDMVLARRVKELGLKALLLDGQGAVFCRMYQNLREVWNGFSKFLFTVFHFQLFPLMLTMVLFDLLLFGPFFFLAWILYAGEGVSLVFGLTVFQVLVLLLARTILSMRFDYSLWEAALHPLAMFHINLLALYSVYLHLSGQGLTWKGRRYITETSLAQETIDEAAEQPNVDERQIP